MATLSRVLYLIDISSYFYRAFHALPALHREIEAWCFANAADERKPDQTDAQFIYSARKKAIGPFKRQLWDLPTKDAILASQGEKIGYLFDQLAVTGGRSTVDRYVTPAEDHRTPPEVLGSAAIG